MSIDLDELLGEEGIDYSKLEIIDEIVDLLIEYPSSEEYTIEFNQKNDIKNKVVTQNKINFMWLDSELEIPSLRTNDYPLAA